MQQTVHTNKLKHIIISDKWTLEEIMRLVVLSVVVCLCQRKQQHRLLH